MTPKKELTYFIVLLASLTFIALVINTGFLQENRIDNRDIKRWTYDNGKIVGSEPFTYHGTTDTCWLLIHSYTATPKEMRNLAGNISAQLNHTVQTILLSGHGTKPSDMEGKNLYVWYDEVERAYDNMNCTNINVVGSSFGAALTLKLAEERAIHRVILVSPYLFTNFQPLFAFADFLNYAKKPKPGRISDNEGLKQHVAYMNFPLKPVEYSFDYLQQRRKNLHIITEPTLILHSRSDTVSNPETAIGIFNHINSSTKKLVWYTESDHVLLLDHNRDDVIKKIIEFN